jgi:hypothetical protein
MPKNIAVFSDGTGQDGGVRAEQRLSNVYKLYRVCRPGPDSGIDPRQQVAFYDPGLGTEGSATARTEPVRAFQKLLGQVTGRGVIDNIADCYEFIVNHYEPGDRIFLIGFSRGAYTVRAVANLIRLCGIPTRGAEGGHLPRFRKAIRDIAREAVLDVLEHGAGHPQEDFEAEREELATRFRTRYGSHHESGEGWRSNAAPYFVGVFDTVAALGAKGARRLAIRLGLALGVGLAALGPAVLAGALVASLSSLSFWPAAGAAFALFTLAGWGLLLFRLRRSVRKTIRDYPARGDIRHHRAEWKGEHFPRLLSRFVPFARSANAIDETRADFDRLPWGYGKDIRPDEMIEGHRRFVQMWFAGNHSDVGGSYPEAESRLSDIALAWMIEEATVIPEGLLIDGQPAPGQALGIHRLQLFPAADGLQHCEVAGMRDMLEALPWPLNRLAKARGWAVKVRTIHPDAPVHPSVYDRFALPEARQCNGNGPYRPMALADHRDFRQFYDPGNARAPGDDRGLGVA